MATASEADLQAEAAAISTAGRVFTSDAGVYSGKGAKDIPIALVIAQAAG